MAAPIIRSSHRDFFLARAAQARSEADQATLGHVRERCLRSEAAWQELADRAARNEATRAADEERKAEISSP